MKNIFLLIAIAVSALSCTNKNGPHTAIPAPQQPLYGFIPNWQNDTLHSTLTINASKTDTMYAGISGDTSYVIYKGQKLYLFCTGDKSDSAQLYANGYIGPNPFDSTGSWSSCSIFSGRFWDAANGKWDTQSQSITIYSLYPHFDTTAGNFYTDGI